MTAAEARRLLSTAGWFLLGVAWLWLVSALVDAALSSLGGVTDVLARSAWARAAYLLLAAFVAAAIAIAVAGAHARMRAETLRAAWVVGAIDVALAIAAITGSRGNALPASSLGEGAGFLLAAGAFTLFGAGRHGRRAGGRSENALRVPADATDAPPGTGSR